MLFNTLEFIFIFLPIVAVLFFWFASKNHTLAASWLVIASLFFYGWWNPRFVLLLLVSIGFNYAIGYYIARLKQTKTSIWILVGAIVSNIMLLGYYKYVNFFIDTANKILDTHWGSADIILPLGISFFTFTQIAFLVDVYRGISREHNFIHYILFVTWFPHLIAGPVLHHKQMMPQFALPETYKPNAESIAVGITLFSLGLCKKIILADQFATLVEFDLDPMAGHKPLLFASWISALAYSLQLYFDFSGYSDMAIGLSRLFNIKLPISFDSPYKAINIIEFWRRWNITLSKFLRDYLYIPLGGNRHGPVRRYLNVLTTMLLGGLWHGAGWNFVLWGGLHGLLLILNQGWQKWTCFTNKTHNRLINRLCQIVTFMAVVFAWVPFRAANIQTTFSYWQGMCGLNGMEPLWMLWPLPSFPFMEQEILLAIGLMIVWGLPNSQQWLGHFSPAWDPVKVCTRFAWQPTRSFAVIMGIIFTLSVLSIRKNSPFLYFQF